MALTFSPGQLTQRAEFYHQLSQLTAAGLGLPAALNELEQHPPGRSYRAPLRLIRKQLDEGSTFTECLRHLGSWLPEFDVALIQAGEQSGRIDATFRVLGDYYQDRARVTRQMLGDLAYPVFLFHFAVFILPFAQFFNTGDWVSYLLKTFGVLLPVYALVFLVIYATQARHGERWRSVLEVLLHPVPVLGTARRYLALSRLAGALEALITAGVSIIEAWDLAAAASGSPALGRIVRSWRPLVEAGQTPAEVITASARFPQLFVHQYHTGEISGKLDDSLRRLHTYYQEEGSRKLRSLAQWTPRLVYLLIVLAIAVKIVEFWSNYFKQIGAAGGF